MYSLGLAERPDDVEEGLALIFSVTEPDREASGYSLVAEPGQRTAYEAVTSCELDESVLSIRLTEAAATALGLPTELSLELAVDSGQLDTLELGLARVGVPLARRSRG